MATKYAKLKGTLPKFQLEESYQQKVMRTKETLALQDFSVGELGNLFIETQNQIDDLEVRLKAQQLIKEAVSQELIKALEEDNTTSFRMTNGALLYQQDEPYTTVEDKEQYLQWIKENGYEGLLTVHYQSTNSLAKEELIAGRTPPPGTKVFMKTSIRYRRS